MPPTSPIEAEDNVVQIFTDGACSGNPGPGGYGAILKYGDEEKEISGCDPNTTNNRMELIAVIESLRRLKRPCKVRILTDSRYVVKGMTEWVPRWVRRNWKTSQGKPVLNTDLWVRLLELSEKHEIEWNWVSAHSGHPENERCDQLARKAIEKCREHI